MPDPIYPCLWFDGNARAAADFYCGIFPDSTLISDNGMVVIFELRGGRFMGLNGGPMYSINEGISLVIECVNQEEIDYYWDRLCDGGEESRCGWLKDRFGVSWQVIPSALHGLMSDPARAARVGAVLLPMRKLIIKDLLEA